MYIVPTQADADAIHTIGWCAVCPVDGIWRHDYGIAFAGSTVCVVGNCVDAGALRAAGCDVVAIDGSPGSIATLVAQRGKQGAAEALIKQIDQEDSKPIGGISTLPADDLMRRQLDPVLFAVDGLVPYGLSVLAAPSKYGKSWMVLDMCLAVACGGSYLGYKTHMGTVLYLALEDSYQRLQGRLGKLLRSRPAPTNLHMAIQAPDMDNGLIAQLNSFVDEHPDTNLIVIDTLQKVRGASRGRDGAYANDYREIGALKSFADGRGLALLVVHHLRKMMDSDDPFNRISGTAGIMGASDMTAVITKDKREDKSATLWITGRDVEESQTVIRFDRDSCRWDSLGDAEQYAAAQARLDYEQSPIVQTICKLVEQSGPQGWTGTARQLMEAGLLITGKHISTTAQTLSKELSTLDPLLAHYDGITHERKSNGSGGGKHLFYRFNSEYFAKNCNNIYILQQTEIGVSNDQSTVSNVCNGINDTNDNLRSDYQSVIQTP